MFAAPDDVPTSTTYDVTNCAVGGAVQFSTIALPEAVAERPVGALGADVHVGPRVTLSSFEAVLVPQLFDARTRA